MQHRSNPAVARESFRHRILPSLLGAASLGVCADARGQGSSPNAAASHKPAASTVAFAAPASGPSASDTVVLRDGTSVSCTILGDEPGKPIIVVGTNGVITIPRENVDHVVTSASTSGSSTLEAVGSIRDGSSAPTHRTAPVYTTASARIAGVWLAADVRIDASVLFKHYRVVDGSDAWSSGARGGAVASVSLHFRGSPAVEEDGNANWLGFELGIGAGAHDGFWKVEGATATGFVDRETLVIVGPHYALGHLRPTQAGIRWSGTVLGVAWVPTYVSFFGHGGAPSRGQLNPAGVRLTVDFGHLSSDAGWPAPMLRLVVGWLPDVGPLPTTINAGVGCAFY